MAALPPLINPHSPLSTLRPPLGRKPWIWGSFLHQYLLVLLKHTALAEAQLCGPRQGGQGGEAVGQAGSTSKSGRLLLRGGGVAAALSPCGSHFGTYEFSLGIFCLKPNFRRETKVSKRRWQSFGISSFAVKTNRTQTS